jgi:hypothetical protein
MEARDIFMYYGGAIFLGLLIFLMSGRRRKGMRLRLGGKATSRVGAEAADNVVHIKGAHGRTHEAVPPNAPAGKYSHIQPRGERPLNVVFNFNGHSWDAYEVLGLPAGSSPESVEKAYRAAIKTVDAGSKTFLEAAYHAIQTEWKSFKASGG